MLKRISPLKEILKYPVGTIVEAIEDSGIIKTGDRFEITSFDDDAGLFYARATEDAPQRDSYGIHPWAISVTTAQNPNWLAVEVDDIPKCPRLDLIDY